ncbi:MAG: bifunctional ornithine acetyltransferase/N-acetylglutamate synthase [Candidatus Heteroscillospira sp.]|jgi:glutamate N-acetyltransferase/amino-acid N-acetyltransferase
MEIISGGICAPKGYKANGIHCGIRRNRSKRDLALVVSEKRAAAAGVYTQNLVKGAPIAVTKKNIADGWASAIVCNSGNANTCNADGIEIAEAMCALVEQHTGIPADDVIVASTGVIGEKLDITPIKNGMAELAAGLGDHSDRATEAIMTTDTKPKEIAVSFEIGGVECRMGGIGKGSGMIHPNMATMLVFVTSDVAITPEMLQKALSEDVKSSFNMVSVDGDTSTNDTYTVMANGMAGNKLIDSEGEDFEAFKAALAKVSRSISRMIAGDGEGATKLLECVLTGAKDESTAVTVSKSVIASSLVKAAMFGSDANWGRVLCAIGYSGADVDVNRVDVSFASKAGSVAVCKNGAGIGFSEELAKEVLSQDEVQILVELNSGECTATAWGCDLTYDYVKINGDYRT